jgi:hypothetical protein
MISLLSNSIRTTFFVDHVYPYYRLSIFSILTAIPGISHFGEPINGTLIRDILPSLVWRYHVFQLSKQKR